MSDRRFDYLQDLFEKMAAGRLDPARVDWPFAAESWRAVCGEIERLGGECQELRRRAEEAEQGDQYVTGLVREAAEVLGLAPYHGIVHRARAVVGERDRLRREREELITALKPFAEYANGPLKDAIAPDFHRATEVVARIEGSGDVDGAGEVR